MKVLIFFMLMGAALSLECLKTQCGSLSGSKCAQYDKATNTWTIQTCPSNQRCNVPYLNERGSNVSYVCENYSPPGGPPKTAQRIAGDACVVNNDCASRSCNSNICEGLTQGVTCVDTIGVTRANGSLVCGAGLYCDDSNVCSPGVSGTATCSALTPCTFPNICNRGRCMAIGSVAEGNACGYNNNLCQENAYCSEGVCQTMTVEYTNGSFGSLCTHSFECAPATCNCTFEPNTTGVGRCGATVPYVKSLVNAERAHLQTVASTRCPLFNNRAAGCYPQLVSNLPTAPQGDCYANFKYGTTSSGVRYLIPRAESGENEVNFLH